MITLAFCLATTGLSRREALDDPAFPRPVALGGVHWDDAGVFGQYQSYIRQEGVSVSASASHWHGVADRTAKSRGLNERTAIAWLTNSLKTTTHVIGWDLDFDLDVIRAALIRHGQDPAALIRPQLTQTSLAQVCTTIMGIQNENGEAVTPSILNALDALVPRNGITSDDPHSMAMACRALYVALCNADLIADQEAA